MKLTWNRNDDHLLVDGERKIRCWSKVRNELNGLRPSESKMKEGNRDIFRITPLSEKHSDAVPSMPRIFPVGNWKITGLVNHLDRKKDPYLFPYFISTDAHQPLERWELDAQGFYLRRTGEYIEDTAYGLHFSTSLYTQGCIRIAEESDLRELVRLIDFAFVSGQKPEFIVTE